MPQRYVEDSNEPDTNQSDQVEETEGYDDASEQGEYEVGLTDSASYGPSTVIAALDQIESLVGNARSVPLSANIVLNKAEILDLVQQARDALPDDLVAADAVVADADAVLGRADSAAEAAVTEASMKSRSLLEDAREKADTILAEANDEARRKVERANEEAEQNRQRAKKEVETLLADAQAQVNRLVSSDNVTEEAQRRAHNLVSQARKESDRLTSGADQYVAATLGQTSSVLKDLLRRTEAGLRAVSERSPNEHAPDIDLD